MSTHFRDTGLGEFLGTVNAKPTTDYIKENYPRRGSLLDVYEYLRKEQGGEIDTLKTTTEIMEATGRAPRRSRFFHPPRNAPQQYPAPGLNLGQASLPGPNSHLS